jgi:hypothetical protein
MLEIEAIGAVEGVMQYELLVLAGWNQGQPKDMQVV